MDKIKKTCKKYNHNDGVVRNQGTNAINITILLALIVIPLIFVPLGGTYDHFSFPKVIAILIIVLTCLVLLAIKKHGLNDVFRIDKINILLFIYLLLLIISVFFAENITLAIIGNPSRCEGIITITMYMILFIFSRSFTNIKDKFLITVLITAVIVSLYGIFQTYDIDPFPRDQFRINWHGIAFSTIGNPNFLGSYLVLIIPISVYIYVIRNNKFGLFFYSIFFYCLLSTNTRGAWLGFIISIFCFIVFHNLNHIYKKDEIRSYFALIIVSIAIIVIFNYNNDGAFFKRFLTITSEAEEFLTNSEKSDLTGSNRGFIWKRVVKLIEMRPMFGYGIENLGEAFNKYFSQDMLKLWGEARYIDKAHNEYLHIAVTSGIPSLVMYLTFVTTIIKDGINNLYFSSLNIFLLSSVIGYMTSAFFNVSVVAVAYIYWIFMGFLTIDKTNNVMRR